MKKKKFNPDLIQLNREAFTRSKAHEFMQLDTRCGKERETQAQARNGGKWTHSELLTGGLCRFPL